jgi:hypothetical protein
MEIQKGLKESAERIQTARDRDIDSRLKRLGLLPDQTKQEAVNG